MFTVHKSKVFLYVYKNNRVGGKYQIHIETLFFVYHSKYTDIYIYLFRPIAIKHFTRIYSNWTILNRITYYLLAVPKLISNLFKMIEFAIWFISYGLVHNECLRQNRPFYILSQKLNKLWNGNYLYFYKKKSVVKFKIRYIEKTLHNTLSELEQLSC